MQRLTGTELAVCGAGGSSPAVLVFGLRDPSSIVLMVFGLGMSVVAAHDVRTNGVVPRALWPTVAVLAMLALVVGPITSHDLWSYSFYGRMVSFYGVDPYGSVPAMFPHDFVYPLVRWRHATSNYGPLFTMVSAGLTWIAGDSVLVMRRGFQVLAAASVLWCLSVLARVRRNAALTLVALQPFVWISLVNGGHNDAIVAAVLLAAVLAFDRRQVLRCALLVAIALSIKLTAVFIVVPLAVLLVTRRRWKDAATIVLGPAAALLACEVFFAGSVSNASSSTRGMVSRASLWRPVRWLIGMSGGTATLVAVVGVVARIAWSHRNDASGARGSGSSLSTFRMLSSYTLPWYLTLGVPALALSGDLVLLGIVCARATVMAASYQSHGSGSASSAAVVFTIVPSVILVAAFIWRIADRSGRYEQAVSDPTGINAHGPPPECTGVGHQG